MKPLLDLMGSLYWLVLKAIVETLSVKSMSAASVRRGEPVGGPRVVQARTITG